MQPSPLWVLPEEFGADPMPEGESTSSSSKSSFAFAYKTGKRLFRNPEDEVIGGVASGIAAYFGIQDPLWVRLAFVLITISGGFGIPMYIILWAILPKAETAGDKLAMQGKPINASNIGKIIEEEFENFSSKMSDFGEELGSKKKSFSGGNNGRNALKKGVSLIGKTIRALIELVLKIWKPLIIIVGFALILGFAVAWIASMIGLFYSFPILWIPFPRKFSSSNGGCT